jgi:hypothetical protein
VTRNGAKEFEGEAVGPILLAQGQEIAALGGAGVVNDQIDPAESFRCRSDKTRGSLWLAQVGGMDQNISSATFNFSGEFFQPLGVARGNRDRHPFLGQAPREGQTDALARAGNHRHFAAEV